MAVAVEPGAPIDVESTRSLQPGSVRAGATVRLVGGITGRGIAATVSWDAEFRRIRITPVTPLRPGLPYVVRIRGVRDLSGATLDELFRSRFTVAA